MSDATGGGDDGTLPQWARSFFEEYGSPDLGELGDVFHGPLLDRKYGLRKDDLVEILLDSRMLPEGRDPCIKGMMVGGEVLLSISWTKTEVSGLFQEMPSWR